MLPRCSLSPIPASLQPLLLRSSWFHTSAVQKNNNTADHYKTLDIEPNASATDVKKKFYALSKSHHPDHNPNDPHASERFVKISEAYAVLGSPEKRQRYDRDIQRATGQKEPNVPPGSHSSSTPFGSRPASGLSRRRTQFRGPPPSFYRNGGWGSHGAKRQSQAETASSGSTNTASGFANSGTSSDGGFGSESAQANWSNDVPHFDHEGHFRTQERQDQRRRRRASEEAIDYGGGGSIILNFVLVSGVLVTASLLPIFFDRSSRNNKRNPEE
ncbi:MAG: hypothetical protein Q9190_002274 [Brigantiaea leucoxantha]